MKTLIEYTFANITLMVGLFALVNASNYESVSLMFCTNIFIAGSFIAFAMTAIFSLVLRKFKYELMESLEEKENAERL